MATAFRRGLAGAASDRISIATMAIADGAEVRLFTRNGGNTPRILVATKFLNLRGKTVFNRPDRNGNTPTRYWEVVSATSDTKSDEATRGSSANSQHEY